MLSYEQGCAASFPPDYRNRVPEDLDFVNQTLTDKGYKIESAEKDKIPSNYVTLDNEDDLKKMRLLIEYLEEHDDVQEIYHNWDAPEEE